MYNINTGMHSCRYIRNFESEQISLNDYSRFRLIRARDSKYRHSRTPGPLVAMNDRDKLAFKFGEIEALEHAPTRISAQRARSRRSPSKCAMLFGPLVFSILDSNLHSSSEFFYFSRFNRS